MTAAKEQRGPASFRDPGGHVEVDGERVRRYVNSAGRQNLAALLGSEAARQLTAEGKLIVTRLPPGYDAGDLQDNEQVVVEHDTVAFATYPYEWSPAMLHAAAELTLEMAERLLPEGLGLKDATPFNVLFRGAQPVFVDVLSIERRDPGDAAWLPLGQFVRTFVLPLLANRHFGLGLQEVFLGSREGIEPRRLFRMAGPVRRLTPEFLRWVTLPTWLEGRGSRNGAVPPRRDPEAAAFILRRLFRRLRRTLKKLTPRGAHSVWAGYAQNNSYSAAEAAAKREFVRGVLERFRPHAVFDLGCNDGDFSLMAAEQGAEVLAADSDAAVVDALWRRARAAGLPVNTMAMSFAHPSPPTGWRNRECRSFVERTRGRFDAVLALAVLHHLLVTDRIPLPALLEAIADLTTDIAMLEFVAPGDPMFVHIARGRDHLHASLNTESFLAACSSRFTVLERQQVSRTRELFLLRKAAE